MNLTKKTLMLVSVVWFFFIASIVLYNLLFPYADIFKAALIIIIVSYFSTLWIIKQSNHQRDQQIKMLEQNIHAGDIEKVKLISHKELLLQLAHFDTLTSLPNRIAFNEALNKAITQAYRYNKFLALLFVDVDRFKKISYTLGHQKSDQAIKEIAQRFTEVLRKGDIIARFGDDQFAVLLNEISHPKYAGTVSEKLLNACEKPILIDAHEFHLTASIGICIFPHEGGSLEQLQQNADIALHKVKQSGGGAFQFFTKEMDIHAHEHVLLENALRKAMRNKEFILYFQPQFNIPEGNIVGVEALIRWNSPELGLVYPDKFIPLAEESGFIIELGEWAIYEACRIHKQWQDLGYHPVKVAVNISPKQFLHNDIAKSLETILQKTGMNPIYLELEITETAIMENIESTINKLRAIRCLGISISIDDFGTGYTSISSLKSFPIQTLKIDKSFIKDLGINPDDSAIVSAIISLGHSLGIDVIAEGVETGEQLQFLLDYHCDIAQGYFLANPLSEDKIVLHFKK